MKQTIFGCYNCPLLVSADEEKDAVCTHVGAPKELKIDDVSSFPPGCPLKKNIDSLVYTLD